MTRAVVRRVVIAAAASADVVAIIGWYDKQAPGLGRAFLAEVAKAKRLIQAYPYAFEQAGPTSRRKNLIRFPYALVFRIKGEIVEIVAVIHQSRRPDTFARSDRAI